MSTKKEIQKRIAGIKQIDKTINDGHEKRHKLLSELSQYHRRLILEENLLSTIIWKPCTYGKDFRLTVDRGSENTALGLAKMLDDMKQGGYHWQFEIDPGFHLRFDDYEVSLNFNGIDISATIKKYKIKINTRDIDIELKRYEEYIKNLNAIKQKAGN
jgi:hypothetical protein